MNKSTVKSDDSLPKSVRIDKWLWAARFYKTRPLAVKAIKNGQIIINASRTKPAAGVKIGDVVIIKKGLHETEVEVIGLSAQRGSATIAQTLYKETVDSIKNAEKLKQQLAAQPKIEVDRRKPDKRGIRTNRQLKRGE